MANHLVLIGLHRVGKTTVGKALAESLKRPFIDTDLLIEEKIKTSCREYYRTNGEKAFRDVEQSVLRSLAPTDQSVIALGGGALVLPLNRLMVKTLGTLLYLKCDPEKVKERVDNPAFLTTTWEEMAERRMIVFEGLADWTIDVTDKTAESVVKEVLDGCEQFWAAL